MALHLTSEGMLYAHGWIADVFASCVEMAINASSEVQLPYMDFLLTNTDSTLRKIRGKEWEIGESQVSIYQM